MSSRRTSGTSGTSRLRRLTTKAATRALRWTHDGKRSLRAYTVDEDDEPCPCVSTRSAELNVALEGVVLLEVGPRKQVVRLAPGDACLVPRGLPHAVRVERGGRVLMIDVTGRAAEQGLRVLRASAMPARPLARFDRLWRADVRRAVDPIWTSAMDIVRRMGRRDPLAIEDIAATARMHRAKELLEASFVAPPSLGQLARAVRTNPFYLARGFKQHFAFTPIAYARFLRREHFLWELLVTRERPSLLRLSGDAGFGDYSTFERRIREAFGRAPSTLVEDEPEGAFGPG